ncbi:MAG: amidophosphoribosyltransferase [Lentisphaerae bacterium GWF2_44_16]|nr:MAG: amidophosphoribosyltransferase [Lentisphaerae bacterium GWF2_44_16]
MSEQIKHECGIAMIRLLKPWDYYYKKYGNPLYALNKLYLLMEKQHNRGHDGAGIASIKLDVEPGRKYISIERSNSNNPIEDIFQKVNKEIKKSLRKNPENAKDPVWIKNNLRFCGELFLGHLRYGTFGKNNIENCHPFLRENNWMTKCLVLAGNFNLTNVDELFQLLIDIGQHPKDKSDTVTILEKIGHFLDYANEELFQKFKAQGHSKKDISTLIAKELDIQKFLEGACKKWDGGYVIAGLLGHGDAFVLRDPSGIRPAFYFTNDEFAVVASERPVIQTVFNVPIEAVHEIKPAHALIIRKNGKIGEYQFTKEKKRLPCSFERIYFSRGTDAAIYRERKALGQYLAAPVLKQVNYDFENTVFSFIPNTAETCFMGLMEELHNHCHNIQRDKILKLTGKLTEEKLDEILSLSPRSEKIAVKDVKLRTFITADNHRNDLVAHVYDITYGSLRRNTDSLVVVDDSIVRGTTLRESIIRILDRLGPREIILLSSAPQIRYPDCYGIDMAKLGSFVAFEAAVKLLKETKQEHILDNVYKKAKADMEKPLEKIKNHVKEIYRPFTAIEISKRISELLTPPGINAKVSIIYQTIEDLHKACPNHMGDWYFTGNYPTPGGNKVVNQSFINYIEGRNQRAY